MAATADVGSRPLSRLPQWGRGGLSTLLLGRNFSCTAESSVLQGGGGPWAVAPSPKCCSREGSCYSCAGATGMTPPLSRSGVGNKGGALRSLRLAVLASPPLHLSVKAAARCLLVCSFGRGQRTGLSSASRPLLPHSAAVELGRRFNTFLPACHGGHAVPLLFCCTVEG